jgi:hypothetical protein
MLIAFQRLISALRQHTMRPSPNDQQQKANHNFIIIIELIVSIQKLNFAQTQNLIE